MSFPSKPQEVHVETAGQGVEDLEYLFQTSMGVAVQGWTRCHFETFEGLFDREPHYCWFVGLRRRDRHVKNHWAHPSHWALLYSIYVGLLGY